MKQESGKAREGIRFIRAQKLERIRAFSPLTGTDSLFRMGAMPSEHQSVSDS